MDAKSRSLANLRGFTACLCRYCNGSPRARRHVKRQFTRALRRSRQRVVAEAQKETDPQ
jgi:hypothetical protein